MKGIRKSIKALLWAFVIMFTVLAGYTAYTVTVNGSTWFISSYNPRLANQKQNVVAGSILELYRAGGEPDRRGAGIPP